MPIPEQAQASKLQAEFLDRVLQEVDRASEERQRPPDTVIKEARNRAERLNARLEVLKSERDEAVKAWDERIARLKEEVDRLRDEANEIEKRIREAGGGGGTKPQPGGGTRAQGTARAAKDRKLKGSN
jgi:DNA repair exonuclease SbcCD ATPase subunit